LVEEASSVEMVRRQLRDSGMPVGQQDQLLNRYIAAGTPEARAAAYEYIEDQIFGHIASNAGIDSEALNTILNQIRDERMRSWGIINDTVRHRIYDSEGRGVIRYTDEFGEQHEYALPLYITQTANVIPMVDLD